MGAALEHSYVLRSSFISQIERDRVSPSEQTLYQLATALGLTMGEIFTEPSQTPPHPPGPIVLPEERSVMNLASGVRWERLTPVTDPYVEFHYRLVLTGQKLFISNAAPGRTAGVLCQIEATVDILLKTYGSQAFLPGNLFSDSVYDLLAPAVYEGENEILTLRVFSSLVKARRTSPGPGLPPAQRRPAPPPDLTDLAAAATAELREAGSKIDSALRHDGAALAQHQARAVELAQRVQQATVMLVVARYGARQADPLVRQAAVCMASELAQRLSGNRPTTVGHRMLTDLGAAVAQDQFTPLADVRRGTVPMRITCRFPETCKLRLRS